MYRSSNHPMHMSTRVAHRLALTALVAIFLVPRAGLASEEGEWTVGLMPSYAFVVLDNQLEPEGGGGGVFVQYGMTDAISLQVAGSWTGHAIEATDDDPGGLYSVVSVTLGISYSLDMGRLRPAIDMGAGVLHQRYGDASVTSMEILVGVVADYRLLPWLSVGVAFHYHAFLANPAQYPVYFDAGPRACLHFP